MPKKKISVYDLLSLKGKKKWPQVHVNNELQTLRKKGFDLFVNDVNNGDYPESKHQIQMEKIEFENFLEKVK